LRVAAGQTWARCDYCGVTSVVAGADPNSNAPKLRIEEPPPPPAYNNAVRAPVGAVLFCAAAAYMAIDAWRAPAGVETEHVVAVIVCGVIALALAVAGLLAWREVQRVRRFREDGHLGRATVERISARSTGNTALLTLKIEVTGQPTHQLDHLSTIPAVLIPRVTSGLVLPVIVDREDPSWIEVAWHLV
jgi:hypothetical protein